MPDTEQLHDLFQDHDSFSELLKACDTEEQAFKLLSAVEGVGKQIEEVVQADCDDIGSLEVGWIRLLWEAHHEQDTEVNHTPEQ
jgi:hypothetical protein